MQTYRVTCPTPTAANIVVAYLTSESQTAIWYATGRTAVVLAVATPRAMDAALAFANAGMEAR